MMMMTVYSLPLSSKWKSPHLYEIPLLGYIWVRESLGTQIGLGRGRQNERDLVMVEDPPIDLEEVVVGTQVPRVGPKTRREHSRRFFQFMVP
jgi:hypothetical protein